MTDPAGWLRPDVEISCDPAHVTVRYGFWETTLPAAWVDSAPGFRAFLERRRRIEDVRGVAGLDGVRHLLAAQGCLTSGSVGPSVPFRHVRDALPQRFTAAYGRYYRHPVWHKILTGERHALASWLVHNLHLSRSVGQTAARAALRSADGRARETFRRNALEEYDHFERFFRVHHPSLDIDPAAVASAVPTAATLGFVLQMLYVAEHDWVAHGIVAWFQERTERFAEEAGEFYRAVEHQAQLSGFFQPWLAHVEYDRSSGHADSFAGLLDRDETIERSALERSLHSASFAVHQLLHALDEIAAPPPAGRPGVLRLPPVGGCLDPSASRLLDAWPWLESPVRFAAHGLAHLWEQFTTRGFLPACPIDADPADTAWLKAAIARAALSWMSRADRDADLLACGALLDVLESPPTPTELPRTPACQAIATFLAEAGGAPGAYGLALRPVLAVAPIAEASDLAAIVDRQLAATPVTDLDRAVTLLLQVSELVLAWERETRTPPTAALSW